MRCEEWLDSLMDTVVIGYGSSKSGADAVSISGAKKQYLNENIGPVYDIAILSDGRPVVSHGTAVIRVYNQQSLSDGYSVLHKERMCRLSYLHWRNR